MVFLFEIYLSLLRIFLLLVIILVTVLIGAQSLFAVDSMLKALSLPCLEIISVLTLFVIPIAVIYGASIRKYFWQRENYYNVIIILFSVVTGVIVTLLSKHVEVLQLLAVRGTTEALCKTSSNITFVQILGNSLISMVFYFVGLDIGVSAKHVSHRISHRHKTSKRK